MPRPLSDVEEAIGDPKDKNERQHKNGRHHGSGVKAPGLSRAPRIVRHRMSPPWGFRFRLPNIPNNTLYPLRPKVMTRPQGQASDASLLAVPPCCATMAAL